MRKVLLPVDGSDSSFEAGRYLVDFIGQHGAVAVHVANIQPKPVEWLIGDLDPGVVQEHQAGQAHMALKPVLHELNEAGIAYQTHIRSGDAADELLALAAELGCDHIIMGSRGLGAISGLMLGSVTRKVLHLATIPVTCVKSDHVPARSI